jgi:hypothetical protein
MIATAPVRCANASAARAPATSVPSPAIRRFVLAAINLPASAMAASSAAGLPKIQARSIANFPFVSGKKCRLIRRI